MKRDTNAVARSRANAAADTFRPPDQMRSPRPAATGSRAKRKDHLNAADNTRSEEEPQSETAGLRWPRRWRQSKRDGAAEIARNYLWRGWRPIPVPFKSSEAADRVMREQQPIYHLRLQPWPGVRNVDLVLRRALKSLLRRHKLRCISIRQEPRSGGT